MKRLTTFSTAQVVGLCVVVLLLGLVVASAPAPKKTEKKRNDPCPNACSGKGHCNSNGLCSCNANWAGDDCSLPVTNLQAGHTASGVLEPMRWAFYASQLPANTGASWQVHTVTSHGDCDLFVQRGRVPTHTDFVARDISLAKDFEVTLAQPQQGQYFAGVYSFAGGYSCGYNITFRTHGGGNCPNDCSRHGHCSSGVCSCNAGYIGADCSHTLTQLQFGRQIKSRVAKSDWVYYKLDLPRGRNTFAVIVNETSAGDSDVYIRYGQLPNTTHFDHRDISFEPDYSIRILTEQHGTWYVAVHGYKDTSYQIKAVNYDVCPNVCSGVSHGTCRGDQCQCATHFSGSACETMHDELPRDTVVQGLVSDDIWNYYHFSTNTVDNVVVELTQAEGDAQPDCDLYLRAGAAPTLTEFDHASVDLSKHIKLSIPAPGFQTWHIGIFGAKTCSYSVKHYISAKCASKCKPPHGTCTVEGTCVCNAGYAGVDCQLSVDILSKGETKRAVLSANQWHYYRFRATSSHLSINLLEEQSKGYFWMFASLRTPPDLQIHDFADMESNSQFHSINLATNLARGESVDVYVGVYGSPFNLDGTGHAVSDYKISVWEAPF